MNNQNEFRGNNYQSLKCIWMASQVIEYKLCDYNFDCENCPFDKVMRNLYNEKQIESSDVSNITNIISENLNRIKYDDQLIYLRNNFIAKEICNNTFYLGIDPIFLSFIDTVNSVTITEPKKNINTGQEIISIFGVWGSVSLSAPIELLIHDIPDNNDNDVFKSQWFAIIGTDNQEIAKGRLCQKEWEKIHSNALNIIKDIKSYIPQVGNTMLDGGTQIKFLHQLVGKKRYLNILNSIDSF